MCCYCMIGDHVFRFDPPFPVDPQEHPSIPAPAPNVVPNPWDLERLREYHDLLKRVKALEDQIGCPCEPNKADYLKLFEERIKHLEQKVEEKDADRHPRTQG